MSEEVIKSVASKFAAGIPILPALDLSKALEFYVERMGFRMIIDLDDYAGVERDSVQIHFWPTDDPQFPANSSCRLIVEGIDDLYDEYEAAGITRASSRPVDQPWGFREFTITDVFGNELIFAEEIEGWEES